MFNGVCIQIAKKLPVKRKVHSLRIHQRFDALRFFRNASIAFLALMLIIMPISSSIEYACKKVNLADNSILLMALALLLGLFLVIWVTSIKMKAGLRALEKPGVFAAVTIGCSLLLFVTQLVFLRSAWFESGWDVGIVSDVGNYDNHTDYFSKYPNQILLAGIFQLIGSAINPLAPTISNYFLLSIGGCVSITISVVLTGLIAKKIAGMFAGYAAYFLSLAFVGFSPWMFVPYSDSYGILYPTLVLFLYAYVEKPWIKYPAMVFISVIGYQIKPTSIFILMAIVLVDSLQHVAHLRERVKRNPIIYQDQKTSLKKTACIIACTALAALLSLSLCTALKSSVVDTQPEKAFSLAHFLMMGFNAESKGIYWGDDVAFSNSFETKTERTTADIKEWMHRVEDLGVPGTAKLFTQKCLTNFNDGSLAWAVEGTFFKSLHGSPGVIRAFYGIPDENNLKYEGSPYEYLAHFLWIIILFGCVFSVIDQRPSQHEIVIYLTILALSIFLMIFEARARYLFLYAPFFCIAGTIGWRDLVRFVRERRV